MPLHGKIVVIKRSGGDGTEFPLTASCLFGRKPDCDIRIQLPQVSKEHCKIDFNENKEVILTNLSSVNPTRVNGEVLQQSERLKHGDLITIIDRSFRFEYPPAPTPKKRRSSTSGKSETLQVLQDKQTRDTSTVLSGEKRILELTTDSCLKDETNSEKFQRPLEQTVEVEPKEVESLEQNKTSSPFCELYQMIKQNLDSKTQWKLLGSQPQTPVSTSLCTPKAVSVKKFAGDADSKAKNTPQKAAAITTSDQTGADGSAEEASESVTAKPVVKQRKSLEVASEKITSPDNDKKVEPTTPELATLVQETPKNKWRTSKTQTPLAVGHGSTPGAETKVTHATPQRFTVPEVIEQITGCLSAEKPRTPTRRRSSTEATPIQPASTQGQDGASVAPEQVEDHAEAQPQPSCSLRTSPRTVARKLQAQDDLRELEAASPTSAKQMKRKSEDLETKLPTPKMKRKRVSFGGNLSPELFDKRLPSDSPLRKGAAPRRSLGVPKRKESLLRRASVIGLLTEFEETGPKGNKSPKQSKTPSPKRTPVKARTPSPKRTPAKAGTPSPKRTPAKARTPSPKRTPAKARTPSPKRTPAKARTPSPKRTPVKAKTPSPKMTPVVKTKEKSPVSKAKTSSPARGRSPSPAKSQPIATPISKKSPSPRRQSKITAVAADTAPSLDSTPTVKGRFSVSRVNTPSPTADQEADAVPQTAGSATTHMTPRRKSIKNTAKKTPKRAMQSAVNVLRRRSGVSRASMKIVNSWADIVKFGQTKSKVVVPAKKNSTRGKGKKAVVPKPKTPVRKPNMLSVAEYTSTGHAESPVTIVVGKAHKRLIQAVCAAPKVVPNIAVLKKNRKMDEDLSGVAEIFSTPVSDRQTQSVSRTPSAINTPMRSQSTGMNEMWGLDTPEETGEMVVSPLNVESTAKRGGYSSEAVTRFLQENQEASFIGQMSPEEESLSSGVLVVDMCSDDSGKPQRPDMTTEASTPKMKPEEPDCLTGVKRMMKTPKQKAAPVEDLRGKLLKTPRQQKPEHGECLTGVKRMMKTPKQKVAPVEDLRGKLLKTPRGPRVSGEAGLDGVKELLQTPKCEDKLAQQQQAEEPKGTCEEQQAEEVSGAEASVDAEANRMTEEAHVPCVESLEGESKVESEASPDVSSDPAASDEQAVVTCVEPAEDVSRVEPAEDVSADAESNGATEDQEAQPEGVLCVEEESPPAAVPDTTEDPDVSSVEHQPEENTKVEESTCDITEVEMTSVVPVSLKKPTRGRKAQTSHDSEVAVEISEHPAPVLSARGRRGKKPGAVVVVEAPAEPPLEDAIQQPAALKPRRGRKPVQENLPELATEESPPQDSVGSNESTAGVVVEKPKRGRNTKKASVEQPEVVVDSTAQALGKSIPAAEKEPRVPVKARRGRIAHQDSEDKVKVVAMDIPAVEPAGAKEPVGKPRRGRKAKQDSEEQPESEEKNATPGPEKAQSPAPVSKPRKSKKGGKQQELSVEQVETEKPKRGVRKSKPVPESVPAPETTAPRRGRRGTKQEKELTLTTEVAEGENESKEEEAVGDVPACDSDHAGHMSAPAEAVVVKTVRGRKGKAVVKEEEVPQATPAKRGRRGASVPETAAALEAVALTPARSGARGRAAKPVKAKEVAAKLVEVPPEPVKRAARSTNASTEVSTPAPAAESTSEEPEAEVAPVGVKKGRGKAPSKVQAVAKVTKEQASEAGDITEPLAKETKKSTKSVNWKGNLDVENQTNASPVVKAVRGKRAKIVVVEDDVSQAAAVAAKTSRRTKVESTAPEVTASKPGNKRKATASKAKEDQYIETDLPVKRGRKGAIAPEAVASSEDLTEFIPEGREPTPARGKGRVARKGKAVSKALETDQAVETKDQPKVRRGRTAAAKK